MLLRRSILSWWWTVAVITNQYTPLVHSFVVSHHPASRPPSPGVVALHHSLNVFGAFGDFLNSNNNMRRNSTIDCIMDEDAAAGTFRIVSLPVQAIKPGGLRLFLLLHLMGQQNTPTPSTWKADQPTKKEYVVDFWYLPDRSAVLSITLDEDQITIDRVGSDPSTQYLIQEAAVVEGILSELETCERDDSIAVGDRLLTLKHPDAIESARKGLAFG